MLKSLKTKVLIGFILSICLFIGFVVYVTESNYSRLYDREISKNLENGKAAFRTYYHLQNKFLKSYALSLSNNPKLRKAIDVPTWDKQSIHKTFSQLFEGDKVDVFLMIDRAGKLVVGYSQENYLHAKDFVEFDEVEQALDGQKGATIWQYGGGLYQVVLQPLISGNKLLGVIVVGKNLDSKKQSQEIFEWTNQRIVLSLNDKDYIHAGFPQWGLSQSELLKAVQGDVSMIRLEGEQIFATAKYKFHEGLELYVFHNVEAILQNKSQTRVMIIVSGVIILLFVIFYAKWVAIKFAVPIDALDKAISRLSNSNLTENVVIEENEGLGPLAQNFNNMSRNLTEKQLKLVSSISFKDGIIKAMGNSLFVCDESGLILECNEALVNLLGFPAEEIKSHHFAKYVKGISFPEFAESHVIRSEARYVTKNNDEIPVLFSISSFSDNNNKDYFVCSAIDISLLKEDALHAKNINMQLEKKVGERTVELLKLNEKLRESNKIAESANNAKSDFLANMSHELRTPLNNIILSSDILMGSDGIKQNPQNMAIVSGIKEFGWDLLNQIRDILDLTKMDNGKLDIFFTAINVENFCQKISDKFSPAMNKKNISFKIENSTKPDQCFVSDPHRLNQIVNNLLSNAIKFTNSGEITLSIFIEYNKEDSSLVNIKVKDSGIGIAPEDLNTIFEQFEQVKSPSTSQIGSGLGLTIAKRLTTLLSGTIEVESKLGEGSCFSIVLPLEPAVALCEN